MAILAAAVHARTIGFGFVFDDVYLIVDRAFLHEATSPIRAFAHDFWYGTSYGVAYYRPLVTASLALNGLLLGWEPASFHLVNVLLHAANTALLMALARRLGASLPAATLAAAFFAVHPVAAWPVASVVARVDLLPALFVLLAWIAWAGGRSPLLVGLLFLMAMLCKESAIAFLAVPILAVTSRVGEERRRAGVVVAAAGAALAASIAMRVAAGVGLVVARGLIDPVANPLAQLPPPDRIEAALALSSRYLAYLLAPFDFRDPHNYHSMAATGAAAAGATGPDAANPVVGAILGFLLLAGWSAAIAVLWRRRDRLAAPLAFALLSFLPASNILVPIGSLYAQNFLYLPLLGLSLALAKGLDRAVSGRRLWLAIPVLGLLAFASVREAGIWRDEVALFSSWTERFPAYALGHERLGLAFLHERGDAREAIEPLRRALELYERDSETHYHLGVALRLAFGDNRPALEEALAHTRRAVEINPALTPARVNASKILLALGRPAEAETEARQALHLSPDLAPARISLAESLFRQERYAEAAAGFKDLVALFPADSTLRSPYIVSLLHAGDLEEARRQAEKGRQDFPDFAWLDFCQARVEARLGHKEKAQALLAEAMAKDPAAREWVKQVGEFR